jgi:hypothetical protein
LKGMLRPGTLRECPEERIFVAGQGWIAEQDRQPYSNYSKSVCLSDDDIMLLVSQTMRRIKNIRLCHESTFVHGLGNRRTRKPRVPGPELNIMEKCHQYASGISHPWTPTSIDLCPWSALLAMISVDLNIDGQQVSIKCPANV